MSPHAFDGLFATSVVVGIVFAVFGIMIWPRNDSPTNPAENRMVAVLTFVALVFTLLGVLATGCGIYYGNLIQSDSKWLDYMPVQLRAFVTNGAAR